MASGVGRALGISEEACAELIAAHWERWKAVAPALAVVPDPQALEAWLKEQQRPVADGVLHGLAELAAESGRDDHDAALVLVNRPGVSGDSEPWEGWSHVRKNVEEVSG